jgi:hypothetical protein
MKIERQLESTPCKIYHRVTSRQKNRFGLASSPVPTRRSLRGCSESWATSPQKQNARRRITDGMRADWEANRDELMEFWRSGESENFADSLPRLSGRGSADTLPWAARHLD